MSETLLKCFQVLPISYAGFALMLFGLALMIAEAFAPSFGILGLGGGLAFIIGSIFLMDTSAPGYGISPPLIGTLGLLNLAFFNNVATQITTWYHCSVMIYCTVFFMS